MYNAIYYKDERLLKKFKERFKGVKFFIAPDYSQLGDLDDIENHYRIKKARVVSLWLTLELGAIVIPNITYPTIDSLWFYLNGLEACTVVAFSTMGYVDDEVERDFLIEAVKQTVDKLSLKTIVVFDICGDNDLILYRGQSFTYNETVEVLDSLIELMTSAKEMQICVLVKVN